MPCIGDPDQGEFNRFKNSNPNLKPWYDAAAEFIKQCKALWGDTAYEKFKTESYFGKLWAEIEAAGRDAIDHQKVYNTRDRQW